MSSLSSFASCFVFSKSFPALKVLTFIFSGTNDTARSNLSVPFTLKSGTDARKTWYSGLFSANGFGIKDFGVEGYGKVLCGFVVFFCSAKNGWLGYKYLVAALQIIFYDSAPFSASQCFAQVASVRVADKGFFA